MAHLPRRRVDPAAVRVGDAATGIVVGADGQDGLRTQPHHRPRPAGPGALEEPPQVVGPAGQVGQPQGIRHRAAEHHRVVPLEPGPVEKPSEPPDARRRMRHHVYHRSTPRRRGERPRHRAGQGEVVAADAPAHHGSGADEEHADGASPGRERLTPVHRTHQPRAHGRHMHPPQPHRDAVRERHAFVVHSSTVSTGTRRPDRAPGSCSLSRRPTVQEAVTGACAPPS